MTAHLVANLLDVTAHIIGNTGGSAVDTWMRVVDAAHARYPDSGTQPPGDVFADGVQAMHAAGVGDHNATVHAGRRADAIHTAARTLRNAAGRRDTTDTLIDATLIDTLIDLAAPTTTPEGAPNG